MDDDIVGCLVGILVVLSLLGGGIVLAIGLAAVLCVLALVVGVGVATNLALRFVANRFDWRKIDEGWIWLVIATLAALPVCIGLGLALVSLFLALVFAEAALLDVCVFAFLYSLWLGGYIWAWVDPRFERGMADALMSSTFISSWTRLQMRLESNKVRRNLS
jgi:hypothetical protein